MVCHECGKEALPGDRFCNRCGTALEATALRDALDATGTGVIARTTGTDPVADPTAATNATDATDATDQVADPTAATNAPVDDVDARTELLPTTDDGDDHWGDDDPVWAVTGAVPETTTADLPSTEPITEVRMESVDHIVTEAAAETAATPYDFASREPTTVVTSTAQMAAVPAAPTAGRFAFGATTLIGVLGGIVTLVAVFATTVSISSDTRLAIPADAPAAFRTGSWIADDLADNLSIAGLIATLLMVVGGIASGFRWRWGSGLAGGAGLATAGLAALATGLAQIPIDAAHEFAAIPSDEPFTLTITRDLGYWLLVVAGAIGIVLFFASINESIGDRRSGLNPWIAALGALSVVIATGGPLLPEGQAVFSDNWYVVDGPGEPPAMLLVGRLVQLGLLAFAGVLGFLSVRRWGLGVAIGGGLPAVWLAASTLFELTEHPVGPGFRNPGADDMHLHGVTIIGVSAYAAMAVLAAIAAYDQGVRERP